MQALASISLKNRAFTALVVIVVSILGIFAMLTMRQELIPTVSLPQVQVIATEPGASSEQMRERVAQPIEESIRTLENVEGTQSTSTSSLTRVTVELAYGTDTARSSNQIEAAINRLELPDNVEPRVLSGGTGDIPAAVIAISSDLDTSELNARLSDQVVPELERVDGLASISVMGGPETIVRITPNAQALAERGLTDADITQAIDDNGLSIPAGQVSDGERSLDVTVGQPLGSIEDLRAIPVKASASDADPAAAPQVVTLQDVATVEEVLQDPESIARTNGRDSLVLVAIPTADANLVQISTDLNAELDRLMPEVGGGAKADVVFDQAPFIQSSISALAEEGLFGLVFAIAVILVFLLAVRPTIVTAVSIPVSLLMAFVGMLVSGYSLNMLTLAALTISIGRVVDDSIVVIENITRHLSYGTERKQAILTAVREVGGAITASTLATVIVFLPIAVVSGLAGELFRPFSLTVAIAMLSSLFVALTIVPVLAYWFLRAPKKLRDGEATVAEVLDEAERKEERSWLARIYRPALAWTQRHALVTLAIALAVLVGTGFLFPLMKVNLLSDSGQNIASFTQTLPNGTSLEATSEKALEVEERLVDLEGVETVQTTIGANAMGFGGSANEVDYSITTDVDADQEALRATILKEMRAVPESGEIEESAMAQGPLGGGDVTIQITAATVADRQAATDLIMGQFDPDALPASISRVSSDLDADQPTAVVTVDRAKAAERGLSDAAVVGLVAQQMQPQASGTVTFNDRDLDIYLDRGETVETYQALTELTIAGMPLTDVASIEESMVPPTVHTENNRITVTVALTPAGDSIDQVSAEARAAIDAVQDELPESSNVRIGGASADVDETFTQLGIAILAAILLTYVLLVWIFKSLVQPLVLLVSIPFAATGAFGLLVLTQVPLGLPAMIGLLMLIGIVVTNAIVLIDLVNQRRRDGMNLNDAIMDGAMKRLRPILMTAAATIFALLPMAIGITGHGGFISQPLAIVTIGGLVSSTLLTLLLVPVLYRLTEAPGEKRRLRAGTDGTEQGADGSRGGRRGRRARTA
ncbi:MAG: efflux RND transporter permease subunit [Dermabacter sp.]|nr:efflux RND transporter permease subunit [Dermabacter sp.]